MTCYVPVLSPELWLQWQSNYCLWRWSGIKPHMNILELDPHQLLAMPHMCIQSKNWHELLKPQLTIYECSGQRPQTWVLIKRFQLLQTTWCIASINNCVLFPGTIIFVLIVIIVILASLAVHRLTLIVYVHVVVWGCVLYMCELTKMGLWWSWFCNSTFNLGTVRALLCNEALGASCLLAIEGEVR